MIMANRKSPISKRRIGFISTRFLRTDGVSLETEKWVEVLERLGHPCFFFAGASDWDHDRTYVVPEAHFDHPEIKWITQFAFSMRTRSPELSQALQALKDKIKIQIYEFVRKFGIELLIVENALAIPMNIPLGLALTEFIAETGFSTIAHHHDFFWERKRFLVNCVWDYLNMAFPPHLPFIRHVVINSSGSNQLALRTGIPATLIPNVMNFDSPSPPPDEYTGSLREDLGLKPEQFFFLQPTRVVQRKGIEHAIEMIQRLGVNSPLIISHDSGDEGESYKKHLQHYAQMLNVPIRFVSDIVGDRRGITEDGRKIYSLNDLYPLADLVTYPSTIEGFGNAFLEAIYFKRPILVNNYSIFNVDIKPKGFRVIEFDGFISDETVERVREVLNNQSLVEEMTQVNYHLAKVHYSYTVLERHLRTLMMQCFGEEMND
jgi:glycosyltransferase involved in cell wall biosynthesis